MTAPIEVIMAVYNGEKYINEQLESLFDQTNSDFHLIIRDNCSEDETPRILTDWKLKHPKRMTVILGQENLGVIRNFALLLEQTKAPYVMFSDADDIWLPEKVEKTIDLMQATERDIGRDQPVLVHTDLAVVDRRLKTLAPSFWKHTRLDGSRELTFNRALVENIVTGCTMMVNRPLIDLVLPIPLDVPMHDAWISLVASAFGRVVPLKESTILYRQHDSNDTGASRYGFLPKIKELVKKEKRGRIQVIRQNRYRQAHILLERFPEQLTTDQVALVKQFCQIKEMGKPRRFYELWKNNFLESGLLRMLYQVIS